MTEEGDYSSDSQIRWACARFFSGRTLGHPDQIAGAQGWRPAAIVWWLNRKRGWSITIEYVGSENRVCYKLTPGTDRAKLAFPPSARDLAKAMPA